MIRWIPLSGYYWRRVERFNTRPWMLYPGPYYARFGSIISSGGALFNGQYWTWDTVAFYTPVPQHGTYSWHDALTAENKHRCGPAKLWTPPFMQMRGDGTSPTLRGKPCPECVRPLTWRWSGSRRRRSGRPPLWNWAPGWIRTSTAPCRRRGPFPFAASLQRNFGTYSSSVSGRSVKLGASTGTGDESHSRVAVCFWRSLWMPNKYKRAQHRKGEGNSGDVTIRGDTCDDTCSGWRKCKVTKPRRHGAFSLMQIEGPDESWGFYFMHDASSDKSARCWQNVSPTNARTVRSTHTHRRAAQQAVSSWGMLMFLLSRELLDGACVGANDNCRTLLLTPNPKLRGLVSPRCDGEKRGRGAMCPMTACGARQMSMFSKQLFKAIQSVSHS